ncbi:hypothetical protein [Haloquadratum walsbyi]|uniref:hypothetical protein n=1 Tax=Haloquadratum walsbyi TaxID=293091 RepID=UPI0015F48CA0|nr:hypothetical protein [Haloquadratum walsbyi]
MSSSQTQNTVSKEYLENLLESEVNDGRLPAEIEDLLSSDYPLANLTSADREYFRLLSDNISIFMRENHPPRESFAQGDLGAADDPSYQRESIENEEVVRIETGLLTHFARSSRGVDGWQQDKNSETIQTSRVEDNREREKQGGVGGLFK